MPVTLLTPPAAEPVTLAEAKALLRVETADEDALISTLIATARVSVEAATGRALMTQTLDYTLDGWPHGRALALPRPPLQAVESVTLRDAAGVETAWPAQNYAVETPGDRPWLVLAPGVVWPALERAAGAVRIRLRCGYGDQAEDVPPPLRHAVLLLAAHWFENRVPVVVGAPAARFPVGVESLLSAYRLVRL